MYMGWIWGLPVVDMFARMSGCIGEWVERKICECGWPPIGELMVDSLSLQIRRDELIS